MNTNKPCLKPPGRGYWPESQGRVSLQLKKRFLRLIFVRALWRDHGWWTGNKYPWFSTLVLLWRRHREESLNYVRSSEQCHGPLTSQVPGPIWGTIYCFLFVLQLSASLTARTCAYNSHKAALMVCKFKFCAPFNLNSWEDLSFQCREKIEIFQISLTQTGDVWQIWNLNFQFPGDISGPDLN